MAKTPKQWKDWHTAYKGYFGGMTANDVVALFKLHKVPNKLVTNEQGKEVRVFDMDAVKALRGVHNINTSRRLKEDGAVLMQSLEWRIEDL